MATQDARYKYGKLHMPRWEVTIPIAREGKVQFLPIRPTCKAIGVDPQTQFIVIHRRYSNTVREIPFNIDDAGWRPYLSLPSDDAALWIAGINPERCKITARGTLEEFIADAKQTLQALLFKPDYVPPGATGGRVISHSYRSETVHVCDCGRRWRVVDENGEQYVEKLQDGEG